jgi:hypothetical protein
MARSLYLTLLFIVFLLLAGCDARHNRNEVPISDMSLDQLITIIEDSNSPLFLPAIEEIIARGESASAAAPALAQALQFPRRDSYMAGIALISMGPKATAAIPYLISALGNEREVTRAYASFSLGSIGEAAQCAIPKIAPLMWDEDPTVRTSSANAIEKITNNNLVDPAYKLSSSHSNSIPQDIQEGNVTSSARAWWLNLGQYLDWATNEDCYYLEQ